MTVPQDDSPGVRLGRALMAEKAKEFEKRREPTLADVCVDCGHLFSQHGGQGPCWGYRFCGVEDCRCPDFVAQNNGGRANA